MVLDVLKNTRIRKSKAGFRVSICLIRQKSSKVNLILSMPYLCALCELCEKSDFLHGYHIRWTRKKCLRPSLLGGYPRETGEGEFNHDP